MRSQTPQPPSDQPTTPDSPSASVSAQDLPEVQHDMREIVEKLNHSGKRLSKSHRRIAQYIAEHYDKAVFMTASRIGECVGVSESTVVRFASALGYDGYPELQRALQELVRHRLTAMQRFQMVADVGDADVVQTVLKADMSNIRKTIEDMDAREFEDVVSRLLGARCIYVMGLRSAAPLAHFFGHYLHIIFDQVRVVSAASGDVFEEISRIRAEDVLVGISFPRYSSRTLEAMRFARQCGAQVVGITDGPMSPLAAVSDVCLKAHTDMASFVDSLAAPLSVVNALIVSLGLHKREELKQHFAQLEGIWDAHRVYISRENA